MKKTKFIIIIIIVSMSFISCTKGESGLEFVAQEETPSASVSDDQDSAINERLAEESGIRHFLYHVGPVDLPAHTKLDEALEEPISMNFRVDKSLWIIGFKPRVIDATGAELPSDLLFQAIISNEHEENTLCKEGATGNPFISATSNLTEIELPKGYGYPVMETDPLEAKVILYNPTDISYVDVSFELDVIAREMNEFTGMKDVKPLLLDVDPCTHMPIQLEPESFEEQEASFDLPGSGSVIVGQGIVQKFASYVELFKGKDTTSFWRTEAILDENYNIVELIGNPFEDPDGQHFGKDDKITMKVAYENLGKSWFKGASAAAMIYYSIDE